MAYFESDAIVNRPATKSLDPEAVSSDEVGEAAKKKKKKSYDNTDCSRLFGACLGLCGGKVEQFSCDSSSYPPVMTCKCASGSDSIALTLSVDP